MTACIYIILFFVNEILIWYSHYQMFEICYIAERLISYLRTMILSYILTMTPEHMLSFLCIYFKMNLLARIYKWVSVFSFTDICFR
jgi:hypothetical protein